MRQVRDNPRLKTLRLAALIERKCATKVTSCDQQYKNGVTCHRFYKCFDGKAYSCQNPKLGFLSGSPLGSSLTCSEKYWGNGGKVPYLCTNYDDVKKRDDVKTRYHLETPQGVKQYNDDMCKA